MRTPSADNERSGGRSSSGADSSRWSASQTRGHRPVRALKWIQYTTGPINVARGWAAIGGESCQPSPRAA
jgi:hypothetical protein